MKSKGITTREKLFKQALLEAAEYRKQLTKEEYSKMTVNLAIKAVLERIYKKYEHILN